jgi:hypothetical protein
MKKPKHLNKREGLVNCLLHGGSARLCSAKPQTIIKYEESRILRRLAIASLNLIFLKGGIKI